MLHLPEEVEYCPEKADAGVTTGAICPEKQPPLKIEMIVTGEMIQTLANFCAG